MGAEHVSTSIETVRSILIDASPNHQAILTPSPYGYPLLLQPQPRLLRAIYLAPTADVESAIEQARGRLTNAKEPLLALLPPYEPSREVIARIFVFGREEKVNLSGSLRDSPVTRYVSPQQGSGHVWASDWEQGKTAYFLTGHSETANLWKVIRIDIDAFGCALFLLSPMRLLSGLPRLNFDQISDALVRNEMEEHYADLQRAIGSHSYRGIITHARSIAEQALGIWLASNGQTPGGDLHGHLAVLRELRSKSKSELEWFSDLAYHAAQKIRLLHARTHIDRAVKAGRTVQPELALSCIEDLKEVLRETRLAGE